MPNQKFVVEVNEAAIREHFLHVVSVAIANMRIPGADRLEAVIDRGDSGFTFSVTPWDNDQPLLVFSANECGPAGVEIHIEPSMFDIEDEAQRNQFERCQNLVRLMAQAAEIPDEKVYQIDDLAIWNHAMEVPFWSKLDEIWNR